MWYVAQSSQQPQFLILTAMHTPHPDHELVKELNRMLLPRLGYRQSSLCFSPSCLFCKGAKLLCYGPQLPSREASRQGYHLSGCCLATQELVCLCLRQRFVTFPRLIVFLPWPSNAVHSPTPLHPAHRHLDIHYQTFNFKILLWTFSKTESLEKPCFFNVI